MDALPSVFIDPIRSKQVELNFALRRIYYRTKGYYQSARKLLAVAKSKGYKFDISDVKKWLHRQAIWQIHSPAPKYIPQVSFNRITRPNEYHQADILYMPWDNIDGKIYKYCLNIVDVASRFKASVPLTDRSSVSVAKAFKKVYRSKKCPLIWPKVLQVDGGTEFQDKTKKVLKEKGVRIRVGTTHKHQSIVERYNRTLAERLFRIQEAYEFLHNVEDTAWVKNLQEIVDDINNTVTRLIGMTPAEAIQNDEVFALPSKIRIDRLVGMDEKCLPAESLVRYLLDKSEYKGGRRRATDPIWSHKIFTIESSTVVDRQPVMYSLLDGPKKIFVQEELLEVPSDTELPPPASFA